MVEHDVLVEFITIQLEIFLHAGDICRADVCLVKISV